LLPLWSSDEWNKEESHTEGHRRLYRTGNSEIRGELGTPLAFAPEASRVSELGVPGRKRGRPRTHPTWTDPVSGRERALFDHPFIEVARHIWRFNTHLCEEWKGREGLYNLTIFIGTMPRRPSDYHQFREVDLRTEFGPANSQWLYMGPSVSGKAWVPTFSVPSPESYDLARKLEIPCLCVLQDWWPECRCDLDETMELGESTSADVRWDEDPLLT
jgi:hypothetical protein